MTANGDMIIALDRERMQAMADKNVDRLNELLCKDLVYTHSSARLDTKESLIGAMESGATVYTSVEPSDVAAQDLGDAVVLTGAAKITVVANGNPNSFGVRFTDVYHNQNGTWRMVAWQSTKTPD
ncbi:MAG: nuclear transport factor 2 family protein [Rhodospirillaceae bacterium]|nr:nuclear transport factor 2 family protein [Rhodospirillaceae bacterium]MDD9914562.1 nuclear transport factor 2 family protein [Rhodospirillaceae bacterium]MDD9929880.1 nuclear transport factor 2 family protein [Rhodospirillaceae bacterium]